MKLRARWEGPLPDVGDVLRGTGPRVRAAYVITGITIVQRLAWSYTETSVERFHGHEIEKKLYSSARQITRAVFEVERIPIAKIPDGVTVHDWRWDRRDRKPL